MFSEAISSTSCRCRPSSPWIAAAISGSAWAREAVKNESGAEAVLALEDGGVIGEYLHRRKPLRGSRSVVVAVRAGFSRLAHRPDQAKHLRSKAYIYARCGGIPAYEGTGSL